MLWAVLNKSWKQYLSKKADVQPITYDPTNHSFKTNKICEVLLEKQRWTHKHHLSMNSNTDTTILADQQFSSVRILDIVLRIWMKREWYRERERGGRYRERERERVIQRKRERESGSDTEKERERVRKRERKRVIQRERERVTELHAVLMMMMIKNFPKTSKYTITNSKMFLKTVLKRNLFRNKYQYNN